MNKKDSFTLKEIKRLTDLGIENIKLMLDSLKNPDVQEKGYAIFKFIIEDIESIIFLTEFRTELKKLFKERKEY